MAAIFPERIPRIVRCRASSPSAVGALLPMAFPTPFSRETRSHSVSFGPQAAQAMVTPREVDRIIGHAAKFISLAVNKALYPQLSLEEISFLCA